MNSTEGTPRPTPFLYRKVVAPHWLMVMILIGLAYALISMLISAPLLTIILLAVAIGGSMMYRRTRPQEEGAEPRDGWTYLRTYHVWSLSLVVIAYGFVLIDATHDLLTALR